MVFRFTADKPGPGRVMRRVTDMHNAKITAQADKLTSTVSLKGCTLQKGRRGYSDRIGTTKPRSRSSTSGVRWRLPDGKIAFKNVDSLTVLLDAATDFVQDRSKGWRQGSPHEKVTARIEAAAKRSHGSELLAEHHKDYQNLFQRVELDLGESSAESLPTDERLALRSKTGGLTGSGTGEASCFNTDGTS